MIALRETECCALAGTDCRPTALRGPPSRPQLQRDPLDGAQMGFLSRLFGGDAKQTPLQPGDRLVLEGPDAFALPIVGESHYQEALERICGPRTDQGEDRRVEARLVLEDENPHDSMAVRVDINGMTVGYLSRDHARKYRRGLTKAGYGTTNAYCQALIRGGWDRGEGDRGFYGVYLDLFVIR